MSLYLDSAFPEDARRAFAIGLVSGITTNPTLIAQTNLPAEEVITQLCDLSTGIVFHQLTEETPTNKWKEAERMARIRPGRVGIKIPCTYKNLALAAGLVHSGYIVGMTAIFSTAQVYLACQAGAQFIIPYVNRSTRLLGDGVTLVHQMCCVIDAESAKTQIIAASIKTPDEAISSLLAGAHHLSLPYKLIESMGNHMLSNQAIEDFRLSAKKD
ncbi:MAG TPA: transaldolase family protein [Anaerolineales bacterium]|nr:transaldolase family protein [Anaerolineales bacterium]